MDYSFYLNTNIPDYAKLIEYGFEQIGQEYQYKKDLQSSGLYVLVKISSTQIDMRVIDKDFNDDFMPFGVKNSHCAEKTEADNILAQIIETCFNSVNVRNEIISYLKEKYGTVCEYPWEKFPNSCTFKTQNSKKWYALIMDISRNKIGLVGNNIIDVMNVKIASEKIEKMVDNKQYFYAYHQNKQNWISILLDKNTDMEMLKKLIDDSYNLVEKP